MEKVVGKISETVWPLSSDKKIFTNPICKLENDLLFCISSCELLDEVVHWEYNRPIDKARIPSIVKSIIKTGTVDGMFYVAKLDREISPYVCFDGIHRMTALQSLREQGKEYKCIVRLVSNFENVDLHTRFDNINKSMTVPELYRMPGKEEVKVIVEEVVEKVSTRWGRCMTNAGNPRRPNFNVTELTNLLHIAIKKRKVTANQLYKAVIAVNELHKKNKNLTLYLTEKPKEKCKKFDCYLFLGSTLDDLEMQLDTICERSNN